MDLERVIEALAPKDVVAPAAVELTDLAYDARAVTAGALFFCVPGERFDGHAFAADAVERGAAAVVAERRLDLGVPQLVVDDSRSAMGVLAAPFFGDPTAELTVAGVTGTAGKTTTTYLLRSILEAAGRRPGLLGTIESVVGGEHRPAIRTTPEAIDLQRTFREMLDAGDCSCAAEATSHGSELGRLDGVRFTTLAFTNLGDDHLDFHETKERYFEAKRRLFFREPRPRAAVNIHDPWGRKLADELGDALTFGLAEDAALRPEHLTMQIHLRGRFNVENVLAAVASARLLGIGDEEIARGVENVRGVPGRFETVDEGQPFAVVVDYSHKPDALRNVLLTARDLTGGRVICVFGCGGDRDRAKRPVMGRIATELADVAIVTSDNPRSEDPAAIIEQV